jgi:phosphatidylglycerophosphatase A
MTFPICLIGLPWAEHLWILPMAFVVARVMDILKLPPAYQSQSIRGGVGIVLDDAIAGVYALAINHVLVRVLIG